MNTNAVRHETTDMTITGSHMIKNLRVATLAQHLDFLVINTVIAMTITPSNKEIRTSTQGNT